MKKIITLILLFISIISFGQNSEFKIAKKLAKDKMYTEANILFEKLLNKEFGELNEYTQWYCLEKNANCYFALNDYKTTYDKYTLLLKFIKSTKMEILNKDKYVAGVIKIMDDLKLKIPQDTNSTSDSKIASNSNSTTKTETAETKVAETAKPTADDKTVTLTVSGTGKTLEEAKLNALRSAIEQAFGAFISSKTEILNDNLVKDEIVSVTNGNIQKYDVVTEVTLPNSSFAITLNATVSIEKLTSFAQSKGVEVEFKGGMFGLKIKLQKLNEQNELIVATQILGVVHEALQNSFNYEIDFTASPKFVNDNLYSLPISVFAFTNLNYENTIKYLIESLKGLTMDQTEFENYKNINKQIFSLEISFGDENIIIYLRNNYSFQAITNIFKSWDFYVGNYRVSNNVNTIDGPDKFTATPENLYSKQDIYNEPFALQINESDNSHNQEIFTRIYNNGIIEYFPTGSEKVGHFKFPKQKTKINNFKWDQFYKLNEIERLTKFEVNPKGVVSPWVRDGYLLYETSNNIVVVSPCTISSIAGDDISCNVDYLKNNIKQPADDSFGSSYNNTALIGLGSEKNTMGKALLEFNAQQNINWAIPSSKELLLININLAKIGLFDFSGGNEEYKYNTSVGNVYLSSTRDLKTGYVAMKCLKYGRINRSFSTIFINKLKIPLIDYINNNNDININTDKMPNAIYTTQPSLIKYLIQPVKYYKKVIKDNTSNGNNSIEQKNLINNSESNTTDFKVECIEKRIKSSTSTPNLIKSCILNNFKSVSTGEADNKERYSYKYEIFIKKSGAFVKSKNEELFNEKKNELLSLINQKIKKEFDDYATNSETKDCFEGIIFTNYSFDDLGIEFVNDKVNFNAWFDVPGYCFNVSSTAASFSLKEIKSYFNTTY